MQMAAVCGTLIGASAAAAVLLAVVGLATFFVCKRQDALAGALMASGMAAFIAMAVLVFCDLFGAELLWVRDGLVQWLILVPCTTGLLTIEHYVKRPHCVLLLIVAVSISTTTTFLVYGLANFALRHSVAQGCSSVLRYLV